MQRANSRFYFSMRLVAVVVGMLGMPALADDYSDVSQMVRSGKMAEALNRADQFLAGQPKDPQMRFIKGVIQRDTGKMAEAISTFTKLTEDFPELPEPYNNLAVMYAGQGQYDKARMALEMAIRTNPSYATAQENLGDIYAKMASQAYNKALQLDNSNQAVVPKLALIREIFTPGTAKTQRLPSAPTTPPVTPTAATSTPPTVATSPATKPVTTPAPPVAVATLTPPKPVAITPVPPAVTPPVVAVATKPAPTPAADSDAVKDVEAAVAKWASVWSARDVKAYLASYGKDFDTPASMGRKAWEEERTQRINGKSSISVKIDKLTVSVNGNRAAAKFRQDYKAGGLAVSSHKTLDFAKVGEHWLIVKETVGN